MNIVIDMINERYFFLINCDFDAYTGCLYEDGLTWVAFLLLVIEK